MEALKFVKTWVLCPSVSGTDQCGGIDEYSSGDTFQTLSCCSEQYSILAVNQQLYT